MRSANGWARERPNPPASCAGVKLRGSSSSASGVATGLGDDRLADTLVQRPRDPSGKQQPCIVVTEPIDDQLGQSPERWAGLARHEQHRDRLREQPARDERERQCRCLIQPLRIVNHAEQWPLFGHLRQQTEHGQTDHEPIWRFPAAQSKRHAQRFMLWSRQALESTEHRRAQLLQGGERELHLRLDPDRAREHQVRGRPDRVVQQRRLAHPRLASEYESTAFTPAHRVEYAVERRALGVASSQGGVGGHPPNGKPTPGPTLD
jgi:hypothetical protein